MQKLWQKYIGSLLIIFLVFPVLTAAAPDEAARLELEQQLQAIETQISALEQQLSTTKGEKKTLANKIKQLKNEQERLRLQIKSTNIKLGDLDKKISVTIKSIESNQEKIARLKIDLSKLIRLLYQKDQELLLLRLFIEGGLSQAFTETNNYQKLSQSINSLVQETKKTQKELNNQQTAYENQQADPHLLEPF